MTATVTVTVSVVSNQAGVSSLVFPTLGSKGEGVSTTYVLSGSTVATASSLSTAVSAAPVVFVSGGSRLAIARLGGVLGVGVLVLLEL